MNSAATLAVSLVVLAAAAGSSPAAPQTYSHQEYFEHFEGTKTCLECHEEEAADFFHSQHYQWQGDAPNIVNSGGDKLGKLNTMNDFCTNPLPSWIGNAVNSDGAVIAQGCSKCHAGLGRKPSPEMTQEQLENIDCLICHASGYRRDLYQDESGNWEWRPILWKNQAGLDSVAKRIGQPKRTMCLRCHSGAGGGPNYKRGDIEYALNECDADFDVHMAAEGNDMACADCHGGQDHRMRGRGTDLSGTDDPGNPLLCTSCHEERPHAQPVLDGHTERLYCTVCHITEFAKADPTDMARDWSNPQYHEDGNKYSAAITFGSDVKPVLAWFNGNSRITRLGEKVEYDGEGRIPVMIPLGDRKDKQAKLHAFKVHTAVLPVLKDEQWLVPLAVDEFFIDGDIGKAVAEGAAAAYGIHDPAYEWKPAIRYMGIFHEVRPADQALRCLDCHSEGGRVDWKALGYKEDPLLKAFR